MDWKCRLKNIKPQEATGNIPAVPTTTTTTTTIATVDHIASSASAACVASVAGGKNFLLPEVQQTDIDITPYSESLTRPDPSTTFEQTGDPVSCPYWFQVCWAVQKYQRHCTRNGDCLTYKFLHRQDATDDKQAVADRRESAAKVKAIMEVST
jgi:hypothetical protein